MTLLPGRNSNNRLKGGNSADKFDGVRQINFNVRLGRIYTLNTP
jgi:hypothetical protein